MIIRPRFLVTFLLALNLVILPGVGRQSQADEYYNGRLAVDIEMIHDSRAGLAAVLAYIDQHPDIFLAKNKAAAELPSREQRIIARQTWERYLDHVILLDSLGSMYAAIYQEAGGKHKKALPFMLSYAVFLAQYHFAMDFIDRIEKNPALEVILNEPMADLGIGKGSYAQFKFRFLNIIRGVEFARLNVLYKYFGPETRNPLQGEMAEDIGAIWQAGRGSGPTLTAKNAGRVVADLGFTAWFPLQMNVSKMLGRTKVWRPGLTLISQGQIAELAGKLEPGDILLERREWYATNVGIPGYWPHAALYIGTAEERNRYFADPEVRAWLIEEGVADGILETMLERRYPEATNGSRAPQEAGHPVRVVEAIEGGVSFTSLEHSAAADSLAILRPRLSKKAKALAIIRSFQYQGRPYDFNFDFLTDSELVCSELIYKVFEKSAGNEGLALPTSEVMGRRLMSPNDIARLFADEYRTDSPQFDFIYFLDGNEAKGRAFAADAETFLSSWQRPKWHIIQQGLVGDRPASRTGRSLRTGRNADR